jgi:2-hydroxychromene-2-carboxylate isomerase
MSYSNQLEFFFDISSPWTYLAFSQIEALAERTDTEILWRPILVGGVFNAVNETVYEQRANPHPTKGKYYVKDLRDWTHFYGLEIGQPAVFPVRAVEIMRTAIVAQEEGCLPAYAWATFKAYWGELKDVSQADERARLCEQVGLDAQDVEVRIASDVVKQKLKSNTDEVIARGGFGSPTMFVNGDDMYFGNDRLALVEAALRKNIS